MVMLSKQLFLKFVYGLQVCTLCILLYLISIASAFAESGAEILQAGSWQLKAKPRICVTPVVRRLCTMSTDFIWVGTVNADICLLSSQTQQTIQCWQNVQHGDVLQDIVSEVPITYWLSHFGGDAVLAETTIRIITVPQRQIRRRRRHIWSLL